VVLTIADNGGGMDETTLKRAFDHFSAASRRPAPRNGLAQSPAVDRISEDQIRLESHPGQGTRAIILLPRLGLWLGRRWRNEESAEAKMTE
jgi:signal transduction histidine kinase